MGTLVKLGPNIGRLRPQHAARDDVEERRRTDRGHRKGVHSARTGRRPRRGRSARTGSPRPPPGATWRRADGCATTNRRCRSSARVRTRAYRLAPVQRIVAVRDSDQPRREAAVALRSAPAAVRWTACLAYRLSRHRGRRQPIVAVGRSRHRWVVRRHAGQEGDTGGDHLPRLGHHWPFCFCSSHVIALASSNRAITFESGSVRVLWREPSPRRNSSSGDDARACQVIRSARSGRR